jgi:hypothetical protein
VDSFFEFRFGRLGWFTPFFLLWPRWLIALVYSLFYATMHLGLYTTVFMLANRLTGICWPMRQDLVHLSIIITLIDCL